jgi:hypothetical protein
MVNHKMRGRKTPSFGNCPTACPEFIRGAPQGIVKGETWHSHVSPLTIPLGRAVGCLKVSQKFRPTCLKENLKKLSLRNN